MNTQIIALLIQEGGKLISTLMANRSHGKPSEIQYPDPTPRIDLKEITLASAPVKVVKVEQAPALPAPSGTYIKEETPSAPSTPSTPSENKATAIPTGCIPCSLGHYGACTGMLNEAVRFARQEGLSNDTTIDRVNICLDELNAMERGDLRPEMIVNLPPWEKALAEKALTESRAIRHGLEGLESVEQLEQLAATLQTTRQDIGRAWFQAKLKSLTPEEKAEMQQRIMARLESGETSDG